MQCAESILFDFQANHGAFFEQEATAGVAAESNSFQS